MKKLSTIIFLVAVILAALYAAPAGAGDNSLYLLQGSPTPNMVTKFPVLLHKYDPTTESLAQVREVVDDVVGADSINMYFEEKIIIIKRKFYGVDGSSSRFYIINMMNPLEEKYFELKYTKDYVDLSSYLFNIPNRGLYEGIELGGKSNKLVGFNLSSMQEEDMAFDVIKYIALYGEVGGGIKGDDFVYANMTEEGNLIVHSKTNKIRTNWLLPEAITHKKNNIIVVLVNNNNILAVSPADMRIRDPKGNGHATFFVLNKQSGKWSQVNVKGDNTGMRGFSIWLAGYVRVSDRKEQNLGKEKRRQQPTKTGIPADWRFEQYEKYVPGILFIYNTNTRKKYEIETGDADSEVLLVEGDYVYYRVYDEIYKSKIGKNKLEEPELLVKDDAVPDIHWAFFGPKVDIPAQ